MMLAVMQPYLFPYMGYFQLIHCSDLFIVYDDVTYIKQGYINRNAILSKGKAERFTVPVPGASSNRAICSLEYAKNVRKPLATIRQAYTKAPYFDVIYPLVERVMSSSDRSIGGLCSFSYKAIFDYLGVEANIKQSSHLEYNRSNPAQDRLVELCRMFNADIYINSIGGKELYEKSYFSSHGIELRFLESKMVEYGQGREPFVPNLSLLDVLMWCGKEDVVNMLNEYSLV